MVERLYQALGLPGQSVLGKRVYKRFFYERGQMGAADRKVFTEDVDVVTWQYTLKPSTVPVQGYENSEREYLEVAVLQIDLKVQRHAGRIEEVVHRTVPYPVVLVLSFGDVVLMSLAHKRMSRAEHEAVVAEEFVDSDWMDLARPTDVEEAFLASISFGRVPLSNFFIYYGALYDRVLALSAARLSGSFEIGETDEKRTHLATYRELSSEIAELRAAIRKEAAFNRQVELNTKIKELESLRKREVEKL